MEDRTKPAYPKRLFEQPDFDLLFKYFDRNQWPSFPDALLSYMHGREGNINLVISTDKEKKAFWDAILNPYKSEIINKLNKYGKSNGVKIWIPLRSHIPQNEINLFDRYLNEEVDFSAELYAIHWWLTNTMKPLIFDRLQGKPGIISEEQDFLKDRVKRCKVILKNFDLLNQQCMRDVELTLSTAEDSLKELKFSELQIETKERKKLCQPIFRFLKEENVCRKIGFETDSKEGIHLIGAYLLFSSGISFRKKIKGTHLLAEQFDIDLKINFRNLGNPDYQ
jgi:hypothetical protein